MKRLIFLFGFLLIFLAGFSQRGFYSDSIRSPNGTDTTVYFFFWTEAPWGISVQYKNLDAADGVLTLGESGNTTDGSVFNELDSDDLPVTLADSTVAFEKMSYNFRYLAINFDRNSCSSGDYIHYQIFRDDKVEPTALREWIEEILEDGGFPDYVNIPDDLLAYIDKVKSETDYGGK